MRILLDENIDPDFGLLLQGHSVETVKSMGWRGLKNGELLQHVRAEFDVFLTRDRGILFQHQHEGHKLKILVIRTPDGHLVSLERQLERILDWILKSNAGSQFELEWIEGDSGKG